MAESDPQVFAGGPRFEAPLDLPPPPGEEPLVLAAVVIGILLMAIQLWLLTVALDLYLAGKGSRIWELALASGAIFLGGRVMVWFLQRRPRVRGSMVDTLGRPPWR